MHQFDLFGAPILPGLRSQGALVNSAEEAALIAALEAIPLSPFRFQGWLGKRQTASFGWSYDFDTAIFSRADPIPSAFLPLRTRAAGFAGLKPDDLAQLLLTRYDPGAGIGWHRDRPVFDDVIGVSLGAPAMMRFRRRRGSGFDRRTMALEPRGAYHLSGEARHDWEHSIAEMTATRWSLTFRRMADR